MWEAVIDGDAAEFAVRMRQDRGFDVNMDLDGRGQTLLHYAGSRSNRSAVIPLLLAHPNIDANAKVKYGSTPFHFACCGYPSCVREMLKESLHSVGLLTMATLTSSSGGSPLGGR